MSMTSHGLSLKRIARRTPQRASQEAKYRRRVKVWLVGKSCFLCGKQASETHHKRGRIGALLLDERFWIPLCREHHRQAHDSPKWVRDMGILCQPGEWNTVPKDL